MDGLEQGKLESLEKRVGEFEDLVLDIYEGFVLGYIDDLDQEFPWGTQVVEPTRESVISYMVENARQSLETVRLS